MMQLLNVIKYYNMIFRFGKFLIFVCFIIILSIPAEAKENFFIKIKILENVSIEIPKTWQIMRDTELVALDTSARSIIDLSGVNANYSSKDGLIFLSKFIDKELFASVNIVKVTSTGAQRNSVKTFNERQMKALDSKAYNLSLSIISQLQGEISNWESLKKVNAGKDIVLKSGCLVSFNGAQTVKFDMYQFYSTDTIFQVTTMSTLQGQHINYPILNRIVNSFNIR